MSRENRIWLIVFLIGAAALAGRVIFSDMAQEYVEVVKRTFVQIPSPTEENPDKTKWVEVGSDDAPADLDVDAAADEDVRSWTEYHGASYADYLEQEQAGPGGNIEFSFWRSAGVWIAALFTLFVLSFLFKDNPFYKIAESVFVGVSAAYWMVLGFWRTLVPNLLAQVFPDTMRSWCMPGLSEYAATDLVYVVPLILSVMLLWRLSPKGGWISRWPMAFFIGTFCGLRLVSFLHADFLSQIRNSIIPLVVDSQGMSGMDAFWESVKNVILVIGVLACIVYFFFSFEHKGVVGGTARLGIWFLMVTFGAAFGYTVMGRIALLAIRIEFLLDDWLWLIDPTGKRAVDTAEAVTAMLSAFGCS